MSDQANQQRLLDLLADRAVFGLSQDEEKELASLQQSHPDVDDHEMDRIVALLESSNPRLHRDSMPDEVRARISAANDCDTRSAGAKGDSKAGSKQELTSGSKQPGFSRNARRDLLIGVLASAATLLVAAMLWQPAAAPPALSLAQRRDQVIAKASDLVRVNWTPTDAKPYSGDVVWSDKLQKGYMRFEGLPINDPTVEQYQLWIFDSVQSSDHPIDGGVFDVTSSEAIVEIDAKLNVVVPSMFAITIERPGGVVVSDRSRLPLIAKRD